MGNSIPKMTERRTRDSENSKLLNEPTSIQMIFQPARDFAESVKFYTAYNVAKQLEIAI